MNDFVAKPIEMRIMDRTLRRWLPEDKIWKRWREYMLVGGMPQSVAEFVESRDFAYVDEVKRGILKLYRNDMAKAPTKDEAKIAAIFDSMPSQLSRPGGAKAYRLSELDKAALAAARHWRMACRSPPTPDEGWWEVPVEFVLE